MRPAGCLKDGRCGNQNQCKGEHHADKYGTGPAQIPVAWAIAKGTLPIIGVTGESQVLDAVRACDVTLTEEEIAGLEATADSLGLNVIRFWEKEMK